MSCDRKFSQSRSNFYLQSFENDDNITFSANKFTKGLIHKCQIETENLSPIGWKKSKNYDDLYTLWIPENRIDYDVLDNCFNWAELCDSCVWVKLNRNTVNCFDEDILDFCICSDWNFCFGGQGGHTPIGEVEYQLKYGEGISQNDAELIEKHLHKCLFCIAGYGENLLVTTIPAISRKQNKPSWKLAQWVAEVLNADFVTVTLLEDKPQMKSLDVLEKIDTWRDIYTDDSEIEISIDKDEFYGKTVLIVDDLYQSGASMWCYAEYLKSIGASRTVGIALVKSLKDSDNKKHN